MLLGSLVKVNCCKGGHEKISMLLTNTRMTKVLVMATLNFKGALAPYLLQSKAVKKT